MAASPASASPSQPSSRAHVAAALRVRERAAAVLLALAALLLAACDGTPTALPARHPDPFACTTDADCISAPYHFEDNACCNASYTQVQSRAFVTWRDAWQAEACGAADCDAYRSAQYTNRPSPALPSACYFEPRCNAGRCGDSCD